MTISSDKQKEAGKTLAETTTTEADSPSTPLYERMLSRLPLPVQHVITATLFRARDPVPEWFYTSPQKAAESQFVEWGWLPALALTSALGVFSVAYAYNSARQGAPGAENFFWLGLLLIFVPSTVRLISPATSRFERISLLCTMSICFYLVKVLSSPLYFSYYDEFLHWRTAEDIARSGHLFDENSLLPVSPFYPGLEIVTNALSRLSGLSIFSAGIVVIGISRLLMILSLFMLYERIMGSARMAGIATALYMTNPHFLFFDGQFGYESLALPLALFMLFTMRYYEILKNQQRWVTFAAWIALLAVIVTHHVTDFIFDGFLLLWAIIYGLQHPARVFRSNLVKTALFGIVMSLAWINVIGNPVIGYLSSFLESALDELGQILIGTDSARQLFVGYAGQGLPIWERAFTLSSVAMITFCLPFGLLCLALRYRNNALICMFGIVSLFYPASQIFRLTNFGSELSDRAAAFLFIALSSILAIFITQFWPTWQRWGWKQVSLLSAAITVLFLGGTILGTGPSWNILPGPYLVAADSRSIEPEGIQDATWARLYLGPNNPMVTDRINQLLMSTLGDQNLVTPQESGVDVVPVFFSSSIGTYEISLLQRARVRYLVVDQRLSQALPLVGFYFEPGETGSYQRTAPIALEALTKFNTVPQINREFDSGDIVIYDVGGLINAPEKP
jgi:hypothetical protein